MQAKDKEYFETLGLKSILDLALIIPLGFEDTSLTINPKVGDVVVEILCLKTEFRVKFLQVEANCLTWNQPVKLVIFNAKKYHYGIFSHNQRHFVKAKADFRGQWQLIQPQILSKINEIVPKYKTKLRKDVFRNLIKKYISLENLLQEGLNEQEAKLILALHKSDKNSIELLSTTKFENNVLPVLKFLEIYNFLKKLSKKKSDFQANYVLNSSTDEFIRSLPFKLTKDQEQALEDIKQDLSSTKAAKRIIMGDVGSGKTVLILASVVIAFPRKSVLMLPTTILAQQVYDEAKKLLPKNIKITLVSSGEKNNNLEEFDFILGTHALMYQKLPVCDLVMIDEQHRFGSHQRAFVYKLVSNGEKRAHFLQFSATPIPRTMSMIHSSVISYSFLRQTPFKKDIEIKIIDENGFKSMLKLIKDEILKNHQIIIIYPLVEESETISYQSLEEGQGFWQKNFEKVYVTHGKDKQKDKVLADFREKGNILLATTVVEVGISLPRLSVMVIVGAERLGLASLHQLRGRLGRAGLKGYCYLFTRFKNIDRLKDFSQTQNGFEIAELDLKYRKSGDLLDGIMQHGQSFKWFDFAKDEYAIKKAKKRLFNYYKIQETTKHSKF